MRFIGHLLLANDHTGQIVLAASRFVRIAASRISEALVRFIGLVVPSSGTTGMRDLLGSTSSIKKLLAITRVRIVSRRPPLQSAIAGGDLSEGGTAPRHG
jgi:hypothetical protein